jgi:hypothetical protein
MRFSSHTRVLGMRVRWPPLVGLPLRFPASHVGNTLAALRSYPHFLFTTLWTTWVHTSQVTDAERESDRVLGTCSLPV